MANSNLIMSTTLSVMIVMFMVAAINMPAVYAIHADWHPDDDGCTGPICMGEPGEVPTPEEPVDYTSLMIGSIVVISVVAITSMTAVVFRMKKSKQA